MNAQYTITVGESELENKTANVKQMRTGKEVTVSLASIFKDFDDIIAKYFTDDEEID